MTMIEENHTPEILAMDAREVRLIVNSMIEAGNGDRFQLTPNSFARLYEYIDHLTAQLAAKDAEVNALRDAVEKARAHAMDVSITALTVVEEHELDESDYHVKKFTEQVRNLVSALAATSRGEG